MANNHQSTRSGGGILTFLFGGLMLIVGCYLFFHNLIVRSNMSVLWGSNVTNIALLIVLVGIFLLFFSRRPWIGWGLVAVGMVDIAINVISNLTILFMPTSFFSTIVMLGLIFAGLGLIARSMVNLR